MRRRRSRSSRWSEYVPAAARHRRAEQLARRREREGRALEPVQIVGRGRQLAQTFWGNAWGRNLEQFSDFANRLPRGRTYARNGSVIDLRIAPGRITALVSGSRIYDVTIAVTPLPEARWRKLCADCAGDIDSLVELLQGRFSDGVMEVLCRPHTGLFPEPADIAMDCSCPDWATMCKHVAAVLYGVGARLDSQPELLFTLRQVDHTALVSATDGGVAAATAGSGAEELAGEDLGAIFGIELTTGPAPTKQPRAKKAPPATQPDRQPKPKRSRKPKEPESPPGKAKRQGSPARPRAAAPDPWVTAAELRQRGVPNHVAQSWLNKGLMTHSGERGIYMRTDDVEALIAQYQPRSETPGRR